MFGLDYLGGAKYPDVILREHPAGWAAGFFGSKVFGNPYPLIDKLLATGRCPRVRIQALWSDTHSFSERDIPAAVAEAREVAKLIKKYPAVEFRFSPLCEHNLDARTMMKFFDAVKPIIPTAQMVNTPYKGAYVDGAITEYHSDAKRRFPGPYDYSHDGEGCVDANVTERRNQFPAAQTYYFWDFPHNGMAEEPHEGDKKVPRDQRNDWPDSNQLDAIIYLHNDKYPTSMPKNGIYKSHAEDKDTGDKKADRPVMILPQKAPRIELRAQNGQVVAASYGAPNLYTDKKRWVYRFADWGYQIAEKAKRIQGIAVLSIYANGKKIGTVNPAFRDGEVYR